MEIWNQHERIKLVPQKIVFKTTNFFSAQYALINKLGIGYIPKFLVDKDLQDQTLFNLMPNWQSKASDISAILPSRKYVSPKVRSFIDLAVDLIK